MNCFEAAFIKRTVVGNKWQTVYERLNFSPYFRKVFRFFCITVSQSMNICGPLSIVIGAGTDQSIDFVYDFSIPTLHTLVRLPLAVSKSIAAKSFICSAVFYQTQMYMIIFRLSHWAGEKWVFYFSVWLVVSRSSP